MSLIPCSLFQIACPSCGTELAVELEHEITEITGPCGFTFLAQHPDTLPSKPKLKKKQKQKQPKAAADVASGSGRVEVAITKLDERHELRKHLWFEMKSNVLFVDAISPQFSHIDLNLGDKVLRAGGKKPTEDNGGDVHRMFDALSAGGALKLIVERYRKEAGVQRPEGWGLTTRMD